MAIDLRKIKSPPTECLIFQEVKDENRQTSKFTGNAQPIFNFPLKIIAGGANQRFKGSIHLVI